MEHITVKDVVAATGGRLLCGDENLPLVHISIDSRTMKGQDLFVPLVGEKVDAHRFIEGAFVAGAAATLTSEHETMEAEQPWIRVADTKKALQDLGAYYRRRLSLPLVGITGSVGKTTTREMVAAALSAAYRVYKTPGNANSQVGLPITLSEITSEDEIGVLELGMSMPGELTVIAGIAQVDMAVITNVGITHIEQLGSQENIYREKLTIQDGLKKGGVLFLNGDDPLLQKTKAKEGCTTVYYGTGENSDYRAEDIRIEEGYPVFTAVCRGRKLPVCLHVMGRHNVLNAMVALAVADHCRVPLAAAAAALSQYEGFRGRQQICEAGGVTIIDDSYNASPVSMKAGLEVLESMKSAKRRIAVLADMKELGPKAAEYHREVGQWLAEHPVDLLFTLGELAEEIARGTRDRKACFPCISVSEADREVFYQNLKGQVRPGDCVLFKGSNSMGLGALVSRFVMELQQEEQRQSHVQ